MAAEQLVVFRLGNEEYAVPISKVKEVVQYKGATKIPNIPHYIEGVINLRGKIIPVFDLTAKFTLTNRNNTEEKAIIFETTRGETAAIVDEVSEVTTLGDGSIESVPAVMTNPCLCGIAKSRDKLIVLLDVEKIFSEEDLAALAEAHV